MPEKRSEYAIYRLSISTLTPLHIGSGAILLHEYDYAIHAGRTWRIDDAAFLDAQSTDDPVFVDQLAATPPARLLRDADFDPASPFFRYVIQGTPRSIAEGAEVQEQLKDTFDRPYLPGSSLKGALRTALAWYGWGEIKLRPLKEDLYEKDRRAPDAPPRLKKDRWAAQDFEHMIFVQKQTRPGREPNYDLLRALHVSDSQPAATGQLMLLDAAVLNCDGVLGSPIEMEAIRPETTFELTAKLDLALFSTWAKASGLDLPGEKGLRALPGIVNRRMIERAREEAAWYAKAAKANRVLSFYQQLLNARLEDNQFLLQLGWGTGWDDKTFGSRLKAEPDFMEELIRAYRLSRGRRQSGRPFPASRRVTVSGEIPVTPLGWLLVTFEPAAGAAGGWETANAQIERPQTAAAPTTSPTHPAPRGQPPATAGAKPHPVEAKLRPEAAQPHTPPARSDRAPAPQEPVRLFAGRPRPGQRFHGTVLDITARQVFIELPGLSGDEYMGVAPLPARKPGEGDERLCEITAVRPDPASPGAWLVDCKIIER